MGEYVTKDSGERKEFSTGMQRDITGDKIRFDLIAPPGIPFEEQMLTRWAALMTRGAVKYGAHNWTKAETQEELDRFRESLFRHVMQYLFGVEDGEDHAAACLFNVAGMELVKWKMHNAVLPGGSGAELAG